MKSELGDKAEFIRTRLMIKTLSKLEEYESEECRLCLASWQKKTTTNFSNESSECYLLFYLIMRTGLAQGFFEKKI